MKGKIFITSSGYDPELGRHVKDPYLGDQPSLGACRPDIRRSVAPGDHIFTISGKIRGIPQFVMGGFEVSEKVHANDAYRMFPKQRLRKIRGDQLAGNVIVNARGEQHRLDTHDGFCRRLDNYIIGKNPIALVTKREIALGRQEMLEALSEILKKRGTTAKELVGRWGCSLTEDQVLALRAWLQKLKLAA